MSSHPVTGDIKPSESLLFGLRTYDDRTLGITWEDGRRE